MSQADDSESDHSGSHHSGSHHSGSHQEERGATEQLAAEGADSSDAGATADHDPAPPKRNVTVVRLPPDQERVVHIIGTAHVSQKSVEEVREVIAEVKPDTVCIELDKMRYEALTDDSRWRKLDIFQVIKQRKMLFLMASLALQAYQKRLGEQLGVRPGSELLAGVEAAKEVGAEVVLADRDVQATLRRTWANLGFLDKLKLLMALVGSVFDGEEIDEERVEELKDSEHIGDLMTEFAKALPQVKKPLIDERDDYLMSTIEEAPGKTLVAVVGAGHVAGMVQGVGKTVDREALRVIPRPSLLARSLKWIIPIVILAAFSWGYYEHRTEGLWEMAKAWVIPNAIAAGLFTLVAGGKLISVLTAIIASPITSLNPTIGAGMVVGLVEAWLRKPTVEDCEKLGKEVTTFKGMYRNPFSRVLIVAVAATIGSALGAYIAAPWVLALL